MTTTPEQIEAALAAFAHASGLGIFPDDEKDEAWDEDLVDGMRAAINAMRPFIRAEVLEEAATAIQNLWRIEDCYGAAAAIRALKERP